MSAYFLQICLTSGPSWSCLLHACLKRLKLCLRTALPSSLLLLFLMVKPDGVGDFIISPAFPHGEA